MANVKAIYLDSNGVYRPAGSSDTIDVGDIKLLNQKTANGVLSTDANGAVSSALLTNDNVASGAAIAGSKIDPNFGSQNIQTTGSVTADSFSGDLNADDLTSGTVPSARVSGSYTGITGVGTIATGTWQGSQISDTYLAQITTANKVANSATTATKNNVNDAIVARDSSGNFSAGIITADLVGDVTGNADTASKWLNSRQVSFAGGDVTGSFDIDGSANVGSVDLTIGALKVTNAMLAGSINQDKLLGSIPDSKLLQITSANKVADSALSSNVALYDASTPAFTNKLGVGSVTASDVGSAATVQFVLDQVAAAEAGLDYKQEAQWYWNLANNGGAFSQPTTVVGFLAGINGLQNTPFTAGDRILLNNESAAATDVGIYVFSGSNQNWTLARSSDYAAASNATGAWIYCLNTLGQAGVVALGQSYVCNTSPATVGTTAIQFVLYAAGKTYTASSPLVMTGTDVSLSYDGALTQTPGKALTVATAASSTAIGKNGSQILKVNVDADTIDINGSNNLAVLGVPSAFEIGGNATNGSVSAANLNTLTAGQHSSADALHAHSLVEKAFARSGAAISDGLAVWFNGSTVTKSSNADPNGGRCIGVVTQDLGTSECYVAVSGVVKITSLQGSPSAGDNLYLNTDGRLCPYTSIPSNNYVTKVGRYLGSIGPSGADMIAISIQEFGIKP